MDSLIDTKPLSLSIGGIFCIIGILVVKYLLESRNKDLVETEKIEYNILWMYSIFSGLVVGFLAMVIYKQFLTYQSQHDILTGSFYGK